MTTTQEKVYQLTKRLIKNDEANSRKLQRELKGVSVAFMAWWQTFTSKYPDYRQEDGTRFADNELRQELDEYARENGLRNEIVSNNEQLLTYATVVFSSVAAYKAIEFISGALTKELKFNAEFGRKLYGITDNELSLSIIDELLDGVKWSDRIWTHQAELRGDMYKLMKKVLLQNENLTAYNKELRNKFNVNRNQADRILRTEGARVAGLQQSHNVKVSGYDKMEWIASAGACDYCRPLDGKVFPASRFGDGEYVIPKHPNCRCSVAAVAE